MTPPSGLTDGLVSLLVAGIIWIGLYLYYHRKSQ